MTTRLLLLSFILLFSIQAKAQSDEEELRYYDVEIIIFKNLRGPKGREVVLPVSLPSKDAEVLDIASPASIKQASAKSYQLLKSEQLQLHDRVEKIVKSPYYELLSHAGWRQPGLSLEESLPIWIRGGKTFGKEYVSIDNQLSSLANYKAATNTADNASLQTATSSISPRKIYELEGKITVSLSRYLHTHADLELRKPRLSLPDIIENTETQSLSNGQLKEAYILDNYSLKEQRRMRSKTLHYLDSPEFAMLVLITPVELDVIDSSQTQ